MPLALLLALCAAVPDGGPEEPSPTPGPAVHLGAALEVAGQALPSGAAPGAPDVYLALHPVGRLRVSDVFALQLGAVLRLRLLDQAPAEAGGLLRQADWDEPSDFGQLLEVLQAGRAEGPVWLRAGPVRERTLGLGHLLARYSNQENVDYHPAAATLAAALGPVRAELFASDVLAGRLFAGELAWDLGRTFSDDPGQHDRYLLALEAAHDAARAGLPTRAAAAQPRVEPLPVTLLHLDASAVVLRAPAAQLTLLAGAGARAGPVWATGFLVGAALDTRLGAVGLSVKLEGRSQGGGFRQGYFGPTYELSRYADSGFSGPPLAQSLLPPGFSGALELRLGVGSGFTLTASGEYLGVGRADLGAAMTLALLRGALTAELRWTTVALGVLPRTAVEGSVRVRVRPSLYLLAAGGTAFLPQPDGTLLRGLSATLGVGLDLAWPGGD